MVFTLLPEFFSASFDQLLVQPVKTRPLRLDLLKVVPHLVPPLRLSRHTKHIHQVLMTYQLPTITEYFIILQIRIKRSVCGKILTTTTTIISVLPLLLPPLPVLPPAFIFVTTTTINYVLYKISMI